jgi:hypothetical protein
MMGMDAAVFEGHVASQPANPPGEPVILKIRRSKTKPSFDQASLKAEASPLPSFDQASLKAEASPLPSFDQGSLKADPVPLPSFDQSSLAAAAANT